MHSWILGEANRCRNAGLSEIEAESFITERMTRRPSPVNEVQTAVAKAYRGPMRPSSTLEQSRLPRHFVSSPTPITNLRFDLSKLKAFVEQIAQPRNWRHWLWERSPKRPDTQNALSFLAHLYLPGENVLLFDKMQSKLPFQSVSICTPMDCRVPTLIRAGGEHGSGIWFLCNPVDGQWHPNPRQENKHSCRSEESVTSFRYLVLESDEAPLDFWLAFIAQLPVRIAAIYTSGGRSVHSLIRLDAASKSEWDSIVAPLKRPMKVLGADPACLSGVRLTRLPHCWRPEKSGFQKLLYLCPNPPLAPLLDLPVLFTREDTLARWRRDCPPGNSRAEAFA